jgi:peptide-methionine (S)-S-oxide reductase
MRSPWIGRGFAVFAIVAFFGWHAVRSIGAGPREPKFPFPKPAVDMPVTDKKGTESVVLAGGCFWGVQAVFEHVKVEVKFDPSQVTFGQILMVYFSVAHDPTELNRQGPDVGSQYRSAIFYTNDKQKDVAIAYVQQLDAAQVYPSRIVTQIAPYKAFYRAEEYHQDYLQSHPNEPYIVYNDLPKLANLKKDFPELYH